MCFGWISYLERCRKNSYGGLFGSPNYYKYIFNLNCYDDFFIYSELGCKHIDKNLAERKISHSIYQFFLNLIKLIYLKKHLGHKIESSQRIFSKQPTLIKLLCLIFFNLGRDFFPSDLIFPRKEASRTVIGVGR